MHASKERMYYGGNVLNMECSQQEYKLKTKKYLTLWYVNKICHVGTVFVHVKCLFN